MNAPFATPIRAAPHNIEAEQALLGAILVNNEAFYRVSDFLEPRHFFEAIHQRIFELCGSLIRTGKLATPVTLKTFLPGDLDIAGLNVNQYLARLAAEATTIINPQDYGRTVYDLSVRRDLIAIGEDMVNLAYDAPVDSTPLHHIEDAERKLYEIAETGRYDSGFQRFAQALTTAVDMAARAYQRDGSLSGLATGLTDLDARMGGLQPSDLIILAGRPGMGKTALATNIAFNAARAFRAKEGEPGKAEDGAVIGFFSLEMSAEQLATRILAEESGVSSDRIRRGDVRREDFDKFVAASQRLAAVPLYIDDTPALSVAALRTRARRLKRQHGLGLIVVDYLQLMRPSTASRGQESRVQEVSEITRGLKAIAKELDVPVLALSQLSRQVENREDKRPQLADLRESGSIEQDADVVMFIFREEYYLGRGEPTRRPEESDDKFNDRHDHWRERCEATFGLAENINAKQRHGPIGTVKQHFEAETTKFDNFIGPETLPTTY